MDVFVANESRFERGPDGVVRCLDGTFGYLFWQRYRDVFSRVIVVARCHESTVIRGQSVTGPGVECWPLADSYGALGALRRWRTWQRGVRPLIEQQASWILRVPGQIGSMLVPQLQRAKRPFGVEVVGDPADVFARGSFRHPLRPALQTYFRRELAKACQQAQAVSYVTQRYLQQRYPANPAAFVTDYSSVELPEEAFCTSPRTANALPSVPHVVHVGTMRQRYKGQHDLLQAVALLRRRGRTLRLTLVGDGPYRSELNALAARLELRSIVHFAGQLPAGEAIRQMFDQADLFVLPSLTEGLPRAMIEAQARALPCLGTSVGGIPELLSPTELVPPGNPVALAAAIEDLLSSPDRMTRLSLENLTRARRFATAELQARRREFCQHVLRAPGQSTPRTGAEVGLMSTIDPRRALRPQGSPGTHVPRERRHNVGKVTP